MRPIAKAWAAAGLALSSTLAGPVAAQWGPWPGATPPAPPTVTLEEREQFFSPYGPSGTDVRRIERRSFWQGFGAPMVVPSPIGPSPSEIRREQRRWFYQGMGMPY
jgi:hypothetical protein